MRTKDFKKVNGYSNRFWGWGGEDDDMRKRIKKAGLEMIRYEPKIARYKMMKHDQAIPNPKRFKILKENAKQTHYLKDGLNNLKYVFLNDSSYD